MTQDKKQQYKTELQQNKKTLKRLKHELHLFNALIDSKPNILQLKNGRSMFDSVTKRYNQRIAHFETIVDNTKKLMRGEDPFEGRSINFSLK